MPVATQQTPIEPATFEPSVPADPLSSEPNAATRTAATPADRLYRMSLEEYHRLAEAGVLSDERVDLIEGLLVKKMTKNTPHIIATMLLEEILHRIKPEG